MSLKKSAKTRRPRWPVLSLSSICGQGQWSCRDEPCSGKCQVYGNGHYRTFDSNMYRFDGHCQYTFVEVRTNDNIYFLFVLLFLMDGSALPTQHRPNPSSYTCLNLLEVILGLLSFCNVDLFPFEDACGTRNGTFSIRVESVPCCDEALTCSRSVVFDLQVNISSITHPSI